jgi:hypothetical protein
MRTPAELHVANVLCRLGADDLVRYALECLFILEEGDRQIKGAEEISLINTALRRNKCGAHPRPVARRVNLSRARQLERERRIERAIKVKMQLGLRELGKEA